MSHICAPVVLQIPYWAYAIVIPTIRKGGARSVFEQIDVKMRICIELFLLDNTLMNALVLLLASAFTGFRMHRLPAFLSALGGAVYALIALWFLPMLLHPFFKIVVGLVMVFALRFTGKYGYLKASGAVSLAALLMGGLVFALTFLTGGTLQQGVLVGTAPARIALCSITLCALLPRVIRALRNAQCLSSHSVRIRITQAGKQKELSALVDTGNLLTEPVSGLPVIVVQQFQNQQWGKPVPYATIHGTGTLNACKPERIELFDQGWVELDAMIASAPYPICDADAIIGANALPGNLKIQ